MTTTTVRPAREECIRAAGMILAEGRRIRDTLPVAEAARRAFTPTGPTVTELEARIASRRTQAVAA
jgi:hypothetical protein